MNDLPGLPLPRLGAEAGAQRFVAERDFAEHAFERGQAQPPLDAQDGNDIVGGVPGFELMEEPEPLLGERERQMAVARHNRDRRGPQTLGRCRRRFNAGGEFRDGGMLEQAAQRQIQAEGFPDSGHHLRRQQGMTTQLEKIVLHSDTFQAEHL